MTGADTIIGGPVHGSGVHGRLPTTQPRRHGPEHGGRLACGLQAGVPRAVPKVGCTMSAGVRDKSLFKDERHPDGTFLQGPPCTEFFFQITP